MDAILDKARKPEYKDIIRAQLFTVDFEEQVISFYVVLDYSSITRDITLINGSKYILRPISNPASIRRPI